MTSPSTPEPAPRGDGHSWLVSEDSAGLFPVHTGAAESIAYAWMAAITAGRDALLEGRIRDLAIAVDDEIPTCGYSPGRDRHGQLKLTPDHITEDLEDLLRDILKDLPRTKATTRTQLSPIRHGHHRDQESHAAQGQNLPG